MRAAERNEERGREKKSEWLRFVSDHDLRDRERNDSPTSASSRE